MSGDGPILDFSLLDAAEPEPEYHRVASPKDVRSGQPKVVRVGVKVIALFRHDGEIYAVNNLCPHAGGRLAQGRMVGRRVVCPRHDWAFDLATGACAAHPVYSATTYPVDVRPDGVYVGIPPGE